MALAFEQPAVHFEQVHNLSGIAGHYHFPDTTGTDRLSLQNRIWKEFGAQQLPHEELDRIYKELLRLNPDQLRAIEIKPGATEELRDVVHGIVSGFNHEDINFYIKRAHGDLPLKQLGVAGERAREEISTRIMQRLKINAPMHWTASESTLDKIWQQVKDLPIINSAEVASGKFRTNAVAMGALVGVGVAGAYIGWKLLVGKDEAPTHAQALDNKRAAPQPGLVTIL